MGNKPTSLIVKEVNKKLISYRSMVINGSNAAALHIVSDAWNELKQLRVSIGDA